MKKTIIHLEDNGQDFTRFVCNEAGVILEALPFQSSIWAGGFIPLDMVKAGEPCPMHKPPHINFGWIKHNVEQIEIVEDEN